MRKLISSNSLVFIALVYNYIANKQISLYTSQITAFISAVEKELDNDSWELAADLDSSRMQQFYGIELDETNKQYSLNLGRYIEWLYESQDIEVVDTTLKRKCLEAIGVNREDLQTTTEYVRESSVMDIFSLEHERAKKSTREILEAAGCKNVVTGAAIPDHLSGDKGYHVSYQCDRPLERAIVLVKTSSN